MWIETQNNLSVSSLNNSVKELNPANLVQLNYISGVVNNTELHYLQKTVFRVSRGNILALYVNLESSAENSNSEEPIGISY